MQSNNVFVVLLFTMSYSTFDVGFASGAVPR